MSVKAKLSIYRGTYVPALTCDRKLHVATERTRLQIEGVEMNFLSKGVRALPYRLDKESGFQEGLRIEVLLLHIKKEPVAWKRLGVTPEELEEVAGEREVGKGWMGGKNLLF